MSSNSYYKSNTKSAASRAKYPLNKEWLSGPNGSAYIEATLAALLKRVDYLEGLVEELMEDGMGVNTLFIYLFVLLSVLYFFFFYF